MLSRCRWLFLFVLAVAVQGGRASNTVLNRVEVASSSAKCLDGSPYSYYVSPGSTPSKFYINMQGGGWCQDLNECAQRAQTALGSSKSWTPTQTFSDTFSRDSLQNPLMANWTLVYLPYCDGGSFTGNAVSATDPPLYFRGLNIREAVVADLRQSYGFNDASDVVVGGCSAGGLAAYLHTDWYASQVPKARAGALPDSGFFLDGNYTRDGKEDYEARMQQMYLFMNSSAGIFSTQCTEVLGYKCLFALYMLPYIKTPVFALNSAYDATMGNGPCGNSGITFNWSNATSVNACGTYIRTLMRKLLQPPSAAFLDACQHHCGEWNSIHIHNIDSSVAFTTWYTKGSGALPDSGFLDQGLPYPCASCCRD
eukprot:TRINITY_DN3008_c0_g1_i7.p1 TRINITY_DN3008_c0_g1~~TRINITY_DN3008_c0_g1_i7.p1  ORF type:complete len:367 (+),score=50.78 TRINITY_DN3008_c0_g1_i7:20-1120(+)